MVLVGGAFAGCAASRSPMGPPPSPAEAAPPLAATSTTAPRYRVYSAFLAIEVDSVDERRALNRRAQQIAAALDGYVADLGAEGCTVRVPVRRLDPALARLGALGEVVDRRVWAEEVTERYVDLSVRRDNLRRLRDRLTALLDRAQTVADVLPIEKELARVTEALEVIEGRLRVLSDRVRLATIEVEYRDAVRPGPVGWIFYGLFRAVKWLFVWE